VDSLALALSDAAPENSEGTNSEQFFTISS